MDIRVFATGGTFDKVYDPIKGDLTFKETHLNEMLNFVGSNLNVVIETVMLLDSLYMQEKDRKQILEKCKLCKEDKIIITHGTDTMIETAKLLGEQIKDKTIILTGAFVPYSFGKSDALFNLGCALGLIQTLDQGVYITMHGHLFRWDNVKKNEKVGKFETIK